MAGSTRTTLRRFRSRQTGKRRSLSADSPGSSPTLIGRSERPTTFWLGPTCWPIRLPLRRGSSQSEPATAGTTDGKDHHRHFRPDCRRNHHRRLRRFDCSSRDVALELASHRSRVNHRNRASGHRILAFMGFAGFDWAAFQVLVVIFQQVSARKVTGLISGEMPE